MHSFDRLWLCLCCEYIFAKIKSSFLLLLIHFCSHSHVQKRRNNDVLHRNVLSLGNWKINWVNNHFIVGGYVRKMPSSAHYKLYRVLSHTTWRLIFFSPVVPYKNKSIFLAWIIILLNYDVCTHTVKMTCVLNFSNAH